MKLSDQADNLRRLVIQHDQNNLNSPIQQKIATGNNNGTHTTPTQINKSNGHANIKITQSSTIIQNNNNHNNNGNSQNISLINKNGTAKTNTKLSQNQRSPGKTNYTPKQYANKTNIIAITSGKGGVGKTNISVNLSIVLSQLGRKVLLVDADMGLANADVLCGLTARWNMSHLYMGTRRTIRDIIIDAPGGFKLLPGANGIGEIADMPAKARTYLKNEIAKLQQSCDVLIYDTSAGINSNVISFAKASNTVLIVVTPEPTSIADAYGLIKAVTKRVENAQIAILINQVENEQQGRLVYNRLLTVTRKFLHRELHFAGTIPDDPIVRKAVHNRQPFTITHPKCQATKAITRLAHTIDRQAGDKLIQKTNNTAGYLKKIMEWCILSKRHNQTN